MWRNVFDTDALTGPKKDTIENLALVNPLAEEMKVENRASGILYSKKSAKKLIFPKSRVNKKTGGNLIVKKSSKESWHRHGISSSQENLKKNVSQSRPGKIVADRPIQKVVRIKKTGAESAKNLSFSDYLLYLSYEI